jgi:two-component system sensor histidine kinase GlrK
VLDVTDSGPGIAADDRDRIFDAFYQGAAAQEGHVKGTGIGLSIAKEYVLAHRGRIELLDNGGDNGGDDGRPGAHFRITLPAEATGVPA